VGGDRTVHAECEPVRPRITVLRAVMNAIFYIAQTGECRLLPKEFPRDTTPALFLPAAR
jgi:transposase